MKIEVSGWKDKKSVVFHLKECPNYIISVAKDVYENYDVDTNDYNSGKLDGMIMCLIEEQNLVFHGISSEDQKDVKESMFTDTFLSEIDPIKNEIKFEISY